MNTQVPKFCRIILLVIFLCLLALTSSGQPTETSGSSPNKGNDYKIGPGDVIDVIVSQNSALTRTGIRVNNQGRIQLPMIDDEVPAACRTERELAEQVREKYKKFLLNPSVIVAVQQFNSSPVAILGAVVAPGRFQLQRPVRVLELLTLVNGATEKAGSSIDLIRNRSLPFCDGPELMISEVNGDELISINLIDTLRGVEEANPYVRAGDVVLVREADHARAFITGNVKTPSIIELKESVTVTQAIAMSGGLASGANSERVLIRRQIDGSANRAEVIVNLKDINQGKKDDVLLRPNDIIEVAGPGKLSTFLRTFVPSLTQLPLRVIP